MSPNVLLAWLLLGNVLMSQVCADEVEVVDAEARATGEGRYHFQVTLRHADSGWDHYANAWQVRGEDGEVYGERTLYHPHVQEQPFTRSLSGVAIPEGVSAVWIRAFDSVHGASESDYPLTLSR